MSGLFSARAAATGSRMRLGLACDCASHATGSRMRLGLAFFTERSPPASIPARPLVSQDPREVLQLAEQLPAVVPANRSGFAMSQQRLHRVQSEGAMMPPSRAAMPGGMTGAHKQSVPGLGGKTKLGGVASYRSMQPAGFGEHSRRRLEEWVADREAEEMHGKIVAAAIESRCDEIDRQCEAKLQLPLPQLADYSMELAQSVLEPEVGRRWAH